MKVLLIYIYKSDKSLKIPETEIFRYKPALKFVVCAINYKNHCIKFGNFSVTGLFYKNKMAFINIIISGFGNFITLYIIFKLNKFENKMGNLAETKEKLQENFSHENSKAIENLWKKIAPPRKILHM